MNVPGPLLVLHNKSDPAYSRSEVIEADKHIKQVYEKAKLDPKCVTHALR